MTLDGGVVRRLDDVETRLVGTEGRLDTIEQQQATVVKRLDAIEVEQGSILAEASASHEQAMLSRVAGEKAVEEVMSFADEYRRNERASYKQCRATHLEVDNRLYDLEKPEDKEIPPPSKVETTLDWEIDEPTNHGDTDPSVAAKIWAERARSAAKEVDDLRKANKEVEVLRAAKAAAEVARAAAEAVLAERSRTSDRAREDAKVAGEFSVKRWQVITGMIVTLCSAGGGIWAIVDMFMK